MNLLPFRHLQAAAPGTVPGITMEYVRDLVNYAHNLGCLTITAIGTSQESADTATIFQIALIKRTEEIQYSLEETS